MYNAKKCSYSESHRLPEKFLQSPCTGTATWLGCMLLVTFTAARNKKKIPLVYFQTFHTPSFGDDEFNLPPLGLNGVTQVLTGFMFAHSFGTVNISGGLVLFSVFPRFFPFFGLAFVNLHTKTICSHAIHLSCRGSRLVQFNSFTNIEVFWVLSREKRALTSVRQCGHDLPGQFWIMFSRKKQFVIFCW